ncbi:MAG: MOSC domain-containing protein [Colwellia sp.]|nr:MOSC domain-containing protein [Colwellia sp.]
MSATKVNSLYIYPIKSTAGISLPSATVNKLGLAFDRYFVLSDELGQFITARTEPRLCLVNTVLMETGIRISAPNMPTITLSYDGFSGQYQQVTVWGDDIAGQVCSTTASQWFSDYLQRPCQLLFFGEKSYRERKANTEKARKLTFTDGYPLLLISQASLDDLNQRLRHNQLSPVSMAQFRPNIVVEHCLPFEEDTWQHIRIGEVEFKVSKPCERCIFTTVNPLSGEKHAEQQPLKTLSSFRQTTQGEVIFGQNLIPLNTGTLKQGDTLEVLSKQTPPSLKKQTPQPIQQGDQSETSFLDKAKTQSKQKIKITYDKWQKIYQGDNQKTLLEHGEEAGLILPYSCRAGMCGRCKAKLVSGTVKQDKNDGLTDQEKQEGYILCCSAIGTSDVVIKHE